MATDASQLDLDAFGVDFGDGVPSAALQIKKSPDDCCVEYRIYSLEKPPRLLRTITGGEFFSAADTDLDGKVEIWADDGAAADGFERLALGELDSTPTLVLRYAHGRLTDVSAEFQSYFDAEITRLRKLLAPEGLEEFKSSDGKLAGPSTPASIERLQRLRKVKIEVLEIVWAYLYSGREQEAWKSLAEMWPTADVERVRTAIKAMRTRGIHSEVDSTSAGPAGKKKRAHIFDAVSRLGAARNLEVVPPQAILLEFPALPGNPPASLPEELLDLVIDSAGKVRLVEPAGKEPQIPSERIAIASTWKFVPAFKDGKPVASRLRIAVGPKQ